MKYPELPDSVAALEEDVLRRWSEEHTFAESLRRNRDGEPFVFYEGPPTANGRPGIHHVLSRTIKDTVARFRTMQGRFVPRIAGWDTHGLPVEIEAEKRLGISGKPEIEAIGIARFNEVCRESVLTYTEEWERFSARIGYWLDYSRPYVTYQAEYIESVWWILKQIADRGLIYRGHKVVPYCPRCGTGLSSHEVALGYRDVKDPSLYLTMPVLGDNGEATGAEFLVWTTTPWTLVANVALAVHPDLEYAEVRQEGRRFILARSRVTALFGDEAEVLHTLRGAELLGTRYQRPFTWVEAPDEAIAAISANHAVGQTAQDRAWRVVPAAFVSAEEGTGIVHMSPAFGADDYAVGREQGLPILQPVDDRGAFAADLPLVGGRFVKEADDDLVRALKQAGRVFRFAREEHTYPHCWRCGSPLLYMARDSWFIQTTALRDQLLENNDQVRWHPSEIGTGRFGEWLENNVDWALSRSRYWGTPLPAWVCDHDPAHWELLGSFAELAERAGALPEDFDPHRPGIDEFTWPCSHDGCSGTMRRTPEVIDVWFDSGSMPFAQHHYPFEDREQFSREFPADFICEGVDQTRGWFYSLMAISTLLGRGPAYRNVLVNDMLLDPEGQKMSKSKGNVVDPWSAIEEFGADAIRWYLLAGSHPWLPKRFDPDGVREVQRKVFDTLRNTYRFFALYAGLEGWNPSAGDPVPAARPALDRWLRSRLASVSREMEQHLEQYNLTHAVRLLGSFVVDDLSNWYVRRSRDRFWGSADSGDTRAAFATLHEALLTVARLAGPFAPFVADWLHRALGNGSVHLADYPTADAGATDAALERAMAAVRELSTLGRSARDEAGVRVRQPLAALYAVIPADVEMPRELLDILRDELNVRRVEFMDRAEELVTFSARPNFRALGGRLGSRTPAVAGAIRQLTSAELSAFRRGDQTTVEVEGERIALEPQDVEVQQHARGAHVVAASAGYTVALDTAITPELRAEGLVRELVNRVQRLRKDAGLSVADRIRLGVSGEPELLAAVEPHLALVGRETLALQVDLFADGLPENRFAHQREIDLNGIGGHISLARVEKD